MKKFLAIFMALMLLGSSMLAMTSCGDNGDDNGEQSGGDDETKLTYTVTVVDQNDAAVSGVSVFALDKDSKPINATPVQTDEGGKVSFSLVEGIYSAMIIGGDGYTVDPMDMNKPFGSDKTVKFRVVTKEEAEKLEYTVTVVDQDGKPIAGVSVQACIDACTPFKNATDADGKTTEALVVTDGEYKAQLTRLPEGYTEQIDEDSNPETFTKYAFDEDRCVTIVLVKK